MPMIKKFNTIPEMYHFLTHDYQKGKSSVVMQQKVNNVYTGITYDQLRDETEDFAMGLASLGVKRNDKVAIISENRPEWVYSDFAILGLGAIDVPLYPNSTSDTIEFILNNCEAKGCIVSNKFHLNKILKIISNCKQLKFVAVFNEGDKTDDNDIYSFNEIKKLGEHYKKENPNHFDDNIKLTKGEDLCTIIYTSGTTGVPKGVMLTHSNILSNVQGAHEVIPIDETDTFLSFLPLCHIFERMAGYYSAFAAGSKIAYAESIEKVSQNLVEVKPTIMTAVPRLFERMYSRIIKNVETQPEKKQKIFYWALQIGSEFNNLRRNKQSVPIGLKIKFKLASKLVFAKLKEKTGGRLRFFISGGAALSRDLAEFFESMGILIIEGYGLTESSPVIACNRINDYKFGTVGKPLPGVEIKIAKDGEILAYGPGIMQGYYKNKKETEKTIVDGWLCTGDIGVFDAEGFLIITDRKKSLFKTTGGKYVAPTPIENLFLASKYIDQFILIGDRRQFLSALIVPDYESLKEYADANRIAYNTPEELVKLKQIYELLDKDLTQFQKKLANYERIRKFTILDKPFTVESGEMTPSLKLKRKVIEERYTDLINDMYK